MQMFLLFLVCVVHQRLTLRVFLMCVFFCFSFVCLHVCAYAFKFKVHCRSAFARAERFWTSYYCTPPVCVPDVIGGLAVWQHNNQKKAHQPLSPPEFGEIALQTPRTECWRFG